MKIKNIVSETIIGICRLLTIYADYSEGVAIRLEFSQHEVPYKRVHAIRVPNTFNVSLHHMPSK